MRKATVRATDLMLLVGTRVALGVGIGLLASGRLDDRARKGAGIALLAVGVLTTVPLLLSVRATTRELPGTEVERAASARGLATEHRGSAAFRDAPMPR
jgi:hypothetical protein